MDDKSWKEVYYNWRIRGYNPFICLLVSGFDVNALDKYGKTTLSYAAEYGNLPILEFLVQIGTDAKGANSDGSRPLHIAAQNGHKDIVKFFLSIGIPVDCRDNDECTPLHYIAEKSTMSRRSCQELIHLLLKHNADLNALNRKGCTPMLLAAQYRHEYIFEIFIKFGANLECRDENHWTALHYSSAFGWKGIVQFLVEERNDVDLDARTSKGDTPLLLAAANCWENIVKLLINSGANTMCRNDEEHLLMHYACQNGWLDLVKHLVNQEQCDLNVKTSFGDTPLLLAYRFKHLSVVEYLVTCNLKPETSKGYRRFLNTNLWLHPSVLEYIVASGAYVDCAKYESIMLHFSARRGLLEVVKSLTEDKSYINVRNSFCDTPLHQAVYGRHLKIVEHLLNAGADCNIKNVRGKSAFSYCILNNLGLVGVVLFLKNGAYFQSDDYDAVKKNRDLFLGIVKNAELCTLAVINYFNCVDLCKIYEIPLVSVKLPAIEKLQIKISSDVAQDIAESVNRELQTKEICNVLNVRPIALKRLCVMTLVQHYNNSASLK